MEELGVRTQKARRHAPRSFSAPKLPRKVRCRASTRLFNARRGAMSAIRGIKQRRHPYGHLNMLKLLHHLRHFRGAMRSLDKVCMEQMLKIGTTRAALRLRLRP